MFDLQRSKIPGLWILLLSISFPIKADPADAVRKASLAILPVMNFSESGRIGNSLYQIISVEILLSGLFDIVEEQDIEVCLERYRVRRMDLMPRDMIIAIGGELKADALAVITVESYQTGEDPEVTLSLSIYSSSTGERVWFGWKTLSEKGAFGFLGIRKQSNAPGLSARVIRHLLKIYASDLRGFTDDDR